MANNLDFRQTKRGRILSELTRLSDHDFELLARDLLGAELGLRLESFARGRDKGVDLRYFAPPVSPVPRGEVQAPDIVVQCKHYVGTGYSGLKSKLKTKERAKVVKLSPKRYILVTSVDLTASNKAELRAILAPYVQTESDIYGASDIEALLKRHPVVEKNHYKLWLTSSAVLDRFLHSEIYRHTEHVLQNIERNAVRYVANASYPAAREALDKNHVCIIAGRAGIGKTTLAEMLLLEYVSNGFHPVVVSADVMEANAIWSADPAVRQIFYYDDFLGQAAVSDKLNKNEDARLDVLLSAVIRTKNKRLILTTREYILEQAKRDYERLERMGLDSHKHVIRLEDYTRLNKAEILYNHLYFSELDPEVRASILAQKVYLKIINHENYTPRLIDDIARRAKLDGTSPSEFPGYFIGILDDPKTLWQHTFDNSLSSEARLVLLSLASLPLLTTLTALRAVYDAFQLDATAKSFFYALKEVDADFVRTTQFSGLTVISFFNPSVRDFVLARLRDSSVLKERLLSRAPFFEQIVALNLRDPQDFGNSAYTSALIRTLGSGGCVVVASGEINARVYELSVMSKVARLAVVLEHSREAADSKWLSGVVTDLAADWAEGYFGGQADIMPVIKLVESHRPAEASMLVKAVAAGFLGKEIEDSNDAEFVRDFMIAYSDAFTDEDRKVVGEFAERFADTEIESLLELKDPTEIRDRFSELQSLADDLGNSISHADALRIEDRIEYVTQVNEGYEDWDGDRSGEYYKSPDPDENAAIDDLFDSMERD